MRYIKRKIINDIENSKQKQRAVAFALTLKEKTSDSSVVRNYTPYKIWKLTGMAYKTIKKYIVVLEKMGLAEIINGDLYIKKMSSSSKHRNIDIKQFNIDKTKNVYNQLRDLLFLVIQSRKDYIKSLLRLRKNPIKNTDFKKVRKISKKCCKNPNNKYKEYGISYSFIARRMGCCVKTAVTIVNDAIKRKWCIKHNRCRIDELFGVNFREVPGYTFTSENYGYKLLSNTYTLSRKWKSALNTVAVFQTKEKEI